MFMNSERDLVSPLKIFFKIAHLRVKYGIIW